MDSVCPNCKTELNTAVNFPIELDCDHFACLPCINTKCEWTKMNPQDQKKVNFSCFVCESS